MDETLNIQELAKYLKCSVSTIRTLVRERKIKNFRVGNRLFFKKSSIDLWISNQESRNMQDESSETKIKPLNWEVN